MQHKRLFRCYKYDWLLYSTPVGAPHCANYHLIGNCFMKLLQSDMVTPVQINIYCIRMGGQEVTYDWIEKWFKQTIKKSINDLHLLFTLYCLRVGIRFFFCSFNRQQIIDLIERRTSDLWNVPNFYGLIPQIVLPYSRWKIFLIFLCFLIRENCKYKTEPLPVQNTE